MRKRVPIISSWYWDQMTRYKNWRMTRLTFGVTSSPFLAMSVLRPVADDYQQVLPML